MGFDPTAEAIEKPTMNGKGKKKVPELATPVGVELSPTNTGAKTAIVELPVHTCHPGYVTPRIDCSLSPRQAAAAKILYCSLSEDGARFKGGVGTHPEGTTVETVAGGIRYFLDRLADAVEAESGKSLTVDLGLSFR